MWVTSTVEHLLRQAPRTSPRPAGIGVYSELLQLTTKEDQISDLMIIYPCDRDTFVRFLAFFLACNYQNFCGCHVVFGYQIHKNTPVTPQLCKKI